MVTRPPGVIAHGKRQYFERCHCDPCVLWRRLRAQYPLESKVELRIRAIQAGQRRSAAARRKS